MENFKKWTLILLLPLLGFAAVHKFYLSVTHVVYSDKDKAIQITSRIFIDDLDQVMRERYGMDCKLATQQELPETDAYLEKYFRKKFSLALNGKPLDYNFLGKKYDADVAIFYVEIPDIAQADIKSISVRDELLTDMFDEQQNVVHIRVGEQKKSFVLTKSVAEGKLNL